MGYVDNFNEPKGGFAFPIIEDALTNYQNYGIYSDLVYDGNMNIDLSILNKDNINDHFFWILNILRDGIEQDRVHNMYVRVLFVDGIDIKLSIFDYLINLILWDLPLSAGDTVDSKYLFFSESITQRDIKNYIDDFFINIHMKDIDKIKLNNIIDDTLYKFLYIDEFSSYLMNTINAEDTIDMMNNDDEVYGLLHADLSNIPIEDVKDVGMKLTNELISKITAKDSTHCLKDAFMAREGVNPKQFKEVYINIGSKPNGQGGVYPTITNSSFIMDGVRNPDDFLKDASVGVQAQAIAKKNVGVSGAFSRKIGLNNMTSIHHDPNYICNTKNFVPIFIENDKILNRLKNRWFRWTINGLEYKLSCNPIRYNRDMIGKVIYLRSPATCASHARGEGICYRCYGNLAYVNNDINVGKMAAELISSKLTNGLLQAKHLLEARVKALNWSEGFNSIFVVSYDSIRIQDDFSYKKWKIVMSSDINFDEGEDEIESSEYNMYINNFEVHDPKGNITYIHTANNDNIYISSELYNVISRKQPIEDTYTIDFSEIINIELFKVIITNDELSETLERLKSIIDKSALVKGKTISEILTSLLQTSIAGDINVDSVHFEVILANQVRRLSDENEEAVLLSPQWEYPNEPYQMITLDRALKDNPSISISLHHNRLLKTLIYPLSYKKTQPSPMDLFFMEQPQEFMNSEINNDIRYSGDEDNNIKIRPVSIVKEENKMKGK